MKTYTDYPFTWLGDVANEKAPIREIKVLSYDGNLYCKIQILTGEAITDKYWGNEKTDSIKAGYIYQEKGRCGEVPTISNKQLKALLAE